MKGVREHWRWLLLVIPLAAAIWLGWREIAKATDG